MSTATIHEPKSSRSNNTGQDTAREHASMRDVRDDVAALKSDAKDCAAGMAETGIETLKHGAEAFCDTATNAARSAKESHEKVNRAIASRPTTSVLIAFGVGALAARLLSRR